MAHDFDEAAQSYDTVFSFSEIGKAQRDRVYTQLKKYVLSSQKPLSILELNCGTGEDAHFFAERQHQVIATDISNGMITEAQRKYGKSNIQFKQQDINEITSETFDQKFDLIFSNFGGLNCLSPNELQRFLKKAPELLNKNGKMLLVIMPKACLWECIYFLAKAQPKKAFRRMTKKAVIANVEGVNVKTWYYSPNDVHKMAISNFIIKKHLPVGIAIPPSYLETFFRTKKGLLSIFRKMEILLHTPFWAKYADHYSILLEKR